MDLCEREVSEGQLCNEPGTETIRIRDAGTGLTHIVKVCVRHKAEHNRSAAERRAGSTK